MSDAAPEQIEQMVDETPEISCRDALLQAIGAKLVQARQDAGESIEDAVRKLKLRKRHLLALESGNWEQMPDDIYALGFLRQYSRYLHVDLSDEIEQLKQDRYALTRPLTFPDPPVAPSRRWAWLAGGAFVLLFIGFNIATDRQSPQHSGNGDTAAEQTGAPHAEAPATAPSQPDQIRPEKNKKAAKPTEHAVQAAAQHPAQSPAIITPAPVTTAGSGAESSPAQDHSTAPADDSKAATPAEKQSAGESAAQPAMHAFRFDAVGAPVWLQISKPDRNGNKGRLLKEVLLQPGFHTTVRARTPSLWITCGNAPELRISVDGKLFADRGTLGAGRKVLRDYRFDVSGH